MALTVKSTLVAAIFFSLAGQPAIASDVTKGKRVFNKCKSCHVANKEKNRVGPHLVGLFGRKSGTVEKYKYSKAMKAAGVVWNEQSLDKYLTNPKKYVKGTKMAFAGLKKKADRENVIAYLKKETAK